MPSDSTPSKRLFTLQDLLEEQLRDLWDAESSYAEYLPAMIQGASSAELQDLLRQCLEAAVENKSQLQIACGLLEVPHDGHACEAMKGLIRECRGHEQEWERKAVHDAALISNCQRIAHYELAGFGTAREFARCLGLKEVAEILGELLETASEIDRALTGIAVGGWFQDGINKAAKED